MSDQPAASAIFPPRQPPPTVVLAELSIPDQIRVVHGVDLPLLHLLRCVLPTVGGIASQIASLEDNLMASVDDLRNLITTRFADLQAESASEKAQVLAAIEALKQAVLTAIPDELMTEVGGLFDTARSEISGIHTPDEPPPPPEG